MHTFCRIVTILLGSISNGRGNRIGTSCSVEQRHRHVNDFDVSFMQQAATQNEALGSALVFLLMALGKGLPGRRIHAFPLIGRHSSVQRLRGGLKNGVSTKIIQKSHPPLAMRLAPQLSAEFFGLLDRNRKDGCTYCEGCENSRKASKGLLQWPISTRRAIVAAMTGVVLQPLQPFAAAGPPPSRLLGETIETTASLDMTSERFPIALVTRPNYGIEVRDVFYPEWMLGKWKVNSSIRSVFAPVGNEAFSPGRNGTEAMRRALDEAPLAYQVRWRRDGADVVVDREYNTASISRASMGADAVQAVQEDGPDHLTLVLRPAGAPSDTLFSADLRVVSRRVDPYPSRADRPRWFTCVETTRQTITRVVGQRAKSSQPQSPLIKEIETIVSYELDPVDPNIMHGFQRTATFIVPDTTYTADPSVAELAASRLARAPNGQLIAIDVRVYDLVYTRI